MKKTFLICLITLGSIFNVLAHPSYHGGVELSGRVGAYRVADNIKKVAQGGVAIDIINGCRFNNYIFLGAGIGVSSIFINSDLKMPSYVSFTPTYINGLMIPIPSYNINNTIGHLYDECISSPVYLDFRAYLPLKSKEHVIPYAEISVGPIFFYHEYTEFMDVKKIMDIKNYADFTTKAYFKVALGINIIQRFTIGAGYELHGDKDDTNHFGFVKLGVFFDKEN